MSAEDRGAYERVLNRALNTTEITTALRRTSETTGAERLRSQASAAAEDIAATARAEYDTYRRLSAAATGRAGPRGLRSVAAAPVRPGSSGWPAVLGVLVPSLAAGAAAVLLLLGYGLRLGGALLPLAGQLLTAGWTAVVIAAVSGLGGLVALLVLASRNRSVTGEGRLPERDPEVARAREAWEEALLERGLMPFLRARIQEDQAHDVSSEQRSRPGFTAPDYSAPEYGSADFASPDYASPDFSSPDFEGPNRE
ncbi:hypothetical protein [Streptomyces sp. TP-A0874]|uniref:hypothetical protein n=1 Tax=Streptomyces sp. TP-A0874 TaxID=549819 RepID=UPI001112E9EB|nr:hypothetical protein [Streptomyces sp. TP-A0874]